eukprot:4150521-Pleurochrysis_carterae.AAC.3
MHPSSGGMASELAKHYPSCQVQRCTRHLVEDLAKKGGSCSSDHAESCLCQLYPKLESRRHTMGVRLSDPMQERAKLNSRTGTPGREAIRLVKKLKKMLYGLLHIAQQEITLLQNTNPKAFELLQKLP